MSTAMKFGQMIKNARETKKISQEKLANELSLSRISINNYEQGRQVPNLGTAVKIALRLDIKLDDLVQDVDKSSLNYVLDTLENQELSDQLKDVVRKLREK